MAPQDGNPEPPKGVASKLTAWGTSSLPPMVLTSLITAQHLRPFQPLPMLFPPLLILSSYLTLAGFKTDGAGMTAAWSGMYVLLAARRRRRLLASSPSSSSLRSAARRFFSLRAVVRGSAVGLGVANTVAGLYVYATGDRTREEEERRAANRWGLYRD